MVFVESPCGLRYTLQGCSRYTLQGCYLPPSHCHFNLATQNVGCRRRPRLALYRLLFSFSPSELNSITARPRKTREPFSANAPILLRPMLLFTFVTRPEVQQHGQRLSRAPTLFARLMERLLRCREAGENTTHVSAPRLSQTVQTQSQKQGYAFSSRPLPQISFTSP